MFSEEIDNLANNKVIYLKIKVFPGADKTCFLERLEDQTIKIGLAAAPEKDKANKELIAYLAKEFKIKKWQIGITSGSHSRVKLLKLIN